jgi:hypothetical protein
MLGHLSFYFLCFFLHKHVHAQNATLCLRLYDEGSDFLRVVGITDVIQNSLRSLTTVDMLTAADLPVKKGSAQWTL